MNKDPKQEINQKFLELSWEHENEPASEQQTKVCVMITDLRNDVMAALTRIAEEARKETREADINVIRSYHSTFGVDATQACVQMKEDLIRSLGRTPSEGETQI